MVTPAAATPLLTEQAVSAMPAAQNTDQVIHLITSLPPWLSTTLLLAAPVSTVCLALSRLLTRLTRILPVLDARRLNMAICRHITDQEAALEALRIVNFAPPPEPKPPPVEERPPAPGGSNVLFRAIDQLGGMPWQHRR